MKPARVLILDRRHESVGGTNHYLDSLIPALTHAGCEVELGLNKDPNLQEFRSKISRHGVIIHDTPICERPPKYVGAWLDELIQQRDPQILHVNCHAADMRKAIIGMPNWNRLECARLFTMHGSIINETHSLATSMMRYAPFSYTRRALIERRTFLSFFDKCVSVSRKNIQTVAENLSIPSSHFQCIPNGVDTAHFQPKFSDHCESECDGRVIIGTCGRLSSEKRLDILVRAFGLLQSSHPRTRLHLIGAGPEEQNLRELVHSLGLTNLVEFKGEQDDVRPALRELDVFTVTSDNEGLPYALLEAMSTSLPSIVSAVNELPHVVRDGREGFTFQRGNVKDLAAKLSLLVSDSRMRTEFGDNARSRVIKNYSQAESLNKTIKFFLDHIPDPNTPPVPTSVRLFRNPKNGRND
ncbi:group 1 glycosyl transferase [Rhodopirellula maiorica SM1]|uniref:Group 1 glycosyl transferase n=1 Tax=Rhodopirellula maiorica SM1 TaxID=1265738 RepID=M5RSX5_9BACT|nr:glycosyltransferase family 4 protein [Rhodopirellula maiorica]EMI22390.1 group 1 glycosyl transferase [Rhodopirellula maiorica SM1]